MITFSLTQDKENTLSEKLMTFCSNQQSNYCYSVLFAIGLSFQTSPPGVMNLLSLSIMVFLNRTLKSILGYFSGQQGYSLSEMLTDLSKISICKNKRNVVAVAPVFVLLKILFVKVPCCRQSM